MFLCSENELCIMLSTSISVESVVLKRFNLHLFRGYRFNSKNRVTLLACMKTLMSDRFLFKYAILYVLWSRYDILLSWHMLLIRWKLIVSTLYKCTECRNHTLLLILSCLSVVAFCIIQQFCEIFVTQNKWFLDISKIKPMSDK